MAKVFAISSGRSGTLLDELVKFSDVETPNVLIIPHSQINEHDGEKRIVETTKGFFHTTRAFVKYKGKNFSNWFRVLVSSDISDSQKVSEYLSWADIYYVPPGDTMAMLNLWDITGFGEIIKESLVENKLLAGISAGANCWFSSFTSLTNEGLQVGSGLNIVNAHMTAHGDDISAKEFHQNIVEKEDLLGFCMVRDTAIAIDGDGYTIIVPKRYVGLRESTEFPLITGYQDNSYYSIPVEATTEYQRTGKKLILKK